MNFLKKLFKRNKPSIETSIETDVSNKEYTSPSSLVYKQEKIVVPDAYSMKPIDPNKPTILLMDDFTGITQLLLSELQRVQYEEVDTGFNIILCTGLFAAFSAKKLLETDQSLDIAFLDITLGGIIDGVEYDGIDIAIMIKKKYPNCIIKFVTGHTLNKHNPEIFKFIQKFENFFKTDICEITDICFKNNKTQIYEHVIPKNGNRVESMGYAIQEYRELEKHIIHKDESLRKNISQVIKDFEHA